MNKSGQSSSSAGAFLLVAGISLYILYKVLLALYEIALRLFMLAVEGVMALVDIITSAVVVFISAVLIILVISLVLDLLKPVFKRISDYKQKVEAVRNCAYPTLIAFRLGQAASKLCLFFAEMLTGKYREDFGEYPNYSTFYNEPDQFTLYKQVNLVKLVFGKYAGQIHEMIIAPLLAAYLAGENSDLVKLVDSAIKAERVYNSAYFTGRYINVITLGRFAIKSGEGVRQAVPAEMRNNVHFLENVIFKLFFRSITQIEKFVSLDEFIHIELRDNHFELEEPYQPTPLKLLAPAPAEVVYDMQDAEVFEGEFEDVENEPPIVSRSEQSVEIVADLLSNFNKDCEALNNPETLLESIHSGLVAQLPYYPDSIFLHEKIAFVSTCLLRLPEFDSAFEQQMQKDPETEDTADWMQQANFEYGDDILTLKGLEGLRRVALRHFLLSSYQPQSDHENNNSFTTVEGF